MGRKRRGSTVSATLCKEVPEGFFNAREKRLQPCRITLPVYPQGGGDARRSSTLHMLLFPPASVVNAGRNALGTKWDAGLCGHVPPASPDKPAAVLLAGSCPVTVPGTPALGSRHPFISHYPLELTSGCHWPG